MEQSQSLCESLVRQCDEAQREAERLRSSFREAERTLGIRERSHRHRVKGLEEQVLAPWGENTVIEHTLASGPLMSAAIYKLFNPSMTWTFSI